MSRYRKVESGTCDDAKFSGVSNQGLGWSAEALRIRGEMYTALRAENPLRALTAYVKRGASNHNSTWVGSGIPARIVGRLLASFQLPCPPIAAENSLAGKSLKRSDCMRLARVEYALQYYQRNTSLRGLQ